MNTQTETQLSPADDFYMWENAKWLNENPIPEEYSTWGSFTSLRDESLKSQISLLGNLMNGDSANYTHNEMLLSLIYKSNMELLKGWDEGKGDYEPIKKEFDILQRIVGFDNNHKSFLLGLAEYGVYCGKHGIGFLVEFDKGEDLTDSQNIKLDVANGSLSLPERGYYFDEQFEKERGLFLQHLKNVESIMKANGIDLGENFVNKVISFETKMAKIKMKSAQARLYDQYFNKINLNEFWNKANDLNFVKDKLDNFEESEREVKLDSDEMESMKLFMSKMYSELDVEKTMFNNYRKNYDEYDAEEAKALCVYDGDYFVRLFKMLSVDNKVFKDEMRAFFQYNVIKSVFGYCTKELYEEFFDFYSRKLSGTKVPLSHEKRTVGKINGWVGEALGDIYVRKHFKEESKKDIEGMINVILGEMRKSLETNDWLTSGTKQKALEKLSSFKVKIGYPAKFKDYSELHLSSTDSTHDMAKKVMEFVYQKEFLDKINSKVDKEEWHMTPQTVNAYYNPLLNEVVFPAAILQPPFYQSSLNSVKMSLDEVGDVDFDALRAINYGSISTVIAHEITHGYDDQGKKFNADGNMINWWTEEDDELFKNKTKLMEDQASQYSFETEGKTHVMKPDLTMGENLADLAGMTLALRAMLSESQFTQDGVPKKQALQLFFRAWATMWRQNITTEGKIERLATDPHAPADFRANLVRNLDEFYMAFDVNEGDKMYEPPSKRVRVW